MTITIDPNGSGTLALGSVDNTAVTADAIAITATSVNALTLTDGTASFALGGTGATTLSAATTVDLDGSGAMSLNSSAGPINIGSDDIDQAINIGTQGERTINIGSSNTAVDFGTSPIEDYTASVFNPAEDNSDATTLNASRNLLAADNGKVLYVEAEITLHLLF